MELALYMGDMQFFPNIDACVFLLFSVKELDWLLCWPLDSCSLHCHRESAAIPLRSCPATAASSSLRQQDRLKHEKGHGLGLLPSGSWKSRYARTVNPWSRYLVQLIW